MPNQNLPRGGKRVGAGRKPKIAKALSVVIAEKLFSEFGGESSAWKALADEAKQRDLRLTFEILRYWTDRKYGKPVQAVEGPAEGGAFKVIVEHIAPHSVTA